MKKMYSVLIAAVMAIGFSAFSPSGNSRTSSQVTYQDDNEDWHDFLGTPCEGNQIPVCIKFTPHGDRQLYYDNDLTKPVKRNDP
jgi:hypothetical protein